MALADKRLIALYHHIFSTRELYKGRPMDDSTLDLAIYRTDAQLVQELSRDTIILHRAVLLGRLL